MLRQRLWFTCTDIYSTLSPKKQIPVSINSFTVGRSHSDHEHEVSARLNKPLSNPISLQYIHRNYHVVKQAEMMLAFTTFQPESNLRFGGTGWAVEMAKLLKKILYVYDVQRNIWFWYRHDQDLFYACDQMSDEQFALPTFLPKTAIVGVTNIYDFPDALLELQDTF